MKTSTKPRLVIHLNILETDEHYYFGSISALYEQFTRLEIGVAQQTLYNLWKDEPYATKKAILRKGRLIQKKHQKT
jgi:hypothetical protein